MVGGAQDAPPSPADETDLGLAWPDSAMPGWPVAGMRRAEPPLFAIGMRTTAGTLRLDARLNRPPTSANGGFACGAIAETMGGTANVRLIRPIPLESPLEVNMDVDGLVARIADSHQRLIAEARRVNPFTMIPPVKPNFADAKAARAASPLRGARHMFSNCVVCGPERRDGLGVTPGPLANRSDVLVAPYMPLERDATNGVVLPAAV